jgi:prepilin signal peptidase PulO-like enzyme (type II secretory pathway)
MGLGDVKFAFLMGLILGFPSIIIAFYLSFLTGAAFSLILVIVGKKKMKATIPFGPFLVTATVVSLFYGQSLWRLFKGILRI